MPSIEVGQTVSVRCPLDSSITVTPGAAGTCAVSVQSIESPSFPAQVIGEACTFSVVAGDRVTISARGASASYYGAMQGIEIQGGAVYALAEATPYVTLTATGTAFTGPCELAGWYCSVAAGNITIYDATSATGTPIVPATALTAGPAPIFGAGTTGKLVLTVGCHVVLSGAATVRMLVA